MANQLQKSPQRIPIYKRPKVQRLAIDGVREGLTISKIARRMERGDPRNRRRWHSILVRTMLMPEVQAEIQGAAMAYIFQELPSTVLAVGRRGRTGRMDAARWLAEASGFHNPRIRHEHSGDIRITIDMPRPMRPDEPIDVEVVED